MEAFLRYIASQDFAIDQRWGYAFLQEILLSKSMGIDIEAQFAQQREESNSIDFLTRKGQLLGTNLTDVPANSIAVVSYSGVMMVNDGWCSSGVKSFDKRVRALYESSAVRGILFEMDTGGGQADAGDIMFNTLADKNKPVVIHTTMMASAGINGGLQATEIIAAAPSTKIGSIGVMATLSKKGLAELAEDNPEGEHTIYSRTSPNKNKELRQAIQGNFIPYEDFITKIDASFMEKVRKNRDLKGSAERQEHTLSGELFLAKEAKSRGLIDGIGSRNYALRRLNSHINFSK